MAGQFRPKLGMGLQSIVAGDRWDQGFPTPIGLPRRPMDESGQMDTGDFTGIPKTMPGTGDVQAKKPGFFGEGGMGRYIAGAIGDALLQNADMQPIFAPMQRDKQRLASEQAQWGLRRQGELADYEQKQQIEAKYRKPDVSPMIRDVQTWNAMSQPDRDAYQAMNDARGGPITTTLPNGQLYVGPRSGLAAALGAGTPQQPLKPVGKLRPVGGPTAPQSGTFR